MKTILIINLTIALLNLIMSKLLAESAKTAFLMRYPDEFLPVSSLSDKISAILRLIIVAVCPIINIIFLFAYIFAWDSMKENVVDGLLEKTA